MANTYLDKLGALREKNPPWNWDDQPAKLGISPNMLNDPAFSEYDLSKIRTYEDDPRIRDAITLRDRITELNTKYHQYGSSGYTYIPSSPYDPNKVYIGNLDKLKMAVGPGAEQIKQGNINKELASTIAHEFRHNLFKDPKYSGIIDAAYNRFGGWEDSNISRFNLEEMINRAADVQLMPESWIGETLEDYEDEYNQMLIERGMPAHLSPMNTTKQFHRSAKEFFEKVRREKLKRPTQINIQKQAIGMPEHLTPPPKKTYTPLPRGGGADVMPVPPPRKAYVAPLGPRGDGGGQRSMPTGTAGRNPWGRADGGLIDFYRYGGFVG